MSEPVRRVEAHYDAYPYPTVAELARPRPASLARGQLDYLLRRRRDDALPRRARVWVAGCGTQQGVHWALGWPDAEVLATDLSDVQLATARNIARQLGVENVRFEKQNLLESEHRDAFDLIVCTGVLHHTPDPAGGLARLRAALRPGGALQLMVYSSVHREPLRAFRDVVDALAPVGDNERRYATACELLAAMLASERCSPPYRSVFEALWEARERDRSFFADAILHPLDASYDVDGLCAFLAGAGLRHTSWLHPHQWNIGTYLDAPEACARVRELAPREQWKAVYTLAGYASPLLEVLCEPVEAPERAPFAPEELLAMPLACDRGATVYRIDAGRVVASGEAAAWEKRDGAIAGRGRGGLGPRYAWSVPDYVEPVLEACDGRRTMGEVVAAFEDEFGREPLLALLGGMLPDDLGLIVPAWP